GTHIVQLKKDLTTIGYGNFPNNPSIFYGEVTESVVKEFQKEQNLVVNGIADEVTLDKIIELLKKDNTKPVNKTEYTDYNLTLNQALDIQMDRPIIITDKYRNDPAYVSANYLRITRSAKVTGSKVNVRTAPDTTSEVEDQLVAGTPITITGTTKGSDISGSDEWYEIAQSGKTHYINSSFATIAQA